MTHQPAGRRCLVKDLSPVADRGCRRDFVEAWTSLDTALSGGLHITHVGPDDEEEAMASASIPTRSVTTPWRWTCSASLLASARSRLALLATPRCSNGPSAWARPSKLCLASRAPAAGAPGLCQHLQRRGHTVVEIERPREAHQWSCRAQAAVRLYSWIRRPRRSSRRTSPTGGVGVGGGSRGCGGWRLSARWGRCVL
jgi:hypothetical protein